MDDTGLPLLPAAAALGCVVAVLSASRRSGERRALRLMLAGGAACGGLAFVFLSLRGIA